jgi:hypothetical protein
MSDTSTPEPAVPATTTPAEPVAVTEPAPDTAPEMTYAEPPAPVEKKKRGVGAWSFVLGLLTALGDLAFLIFVIVALVGAISAISSGDFSGVTTALAAGGLTIAAFFVFFGGFFTGGLAALLGLIALISGRGRVLGFFGLLFGAAAIAVRLLLLSSGQFVPEFG